MQELLFDVQEFRAQAPYEDLSKTRVCLTCHEKKNIQEFEINTISISKVYRKRSCRPCRKQSRVDERILKKIYGKYKPLGTPCDNCGKTTGRLSLDHCHKTGRLRGWLCQGCNTSIGQLGDDIESLERAVAYLKNAELGLYQTPPINLDLDNKGY